MLFSKLTAAQEGSTIVLGDRQHLLLPSRSPSTASAVSVSTWAHAAIWPQQGIISNSSVNSGLFSLCKSHSNGPQTPVICKVSGGGKTVASGTLELDEHACVVFEASCVDTFIDGTIFKGECSACCACMAFVANFARTRFGPFRSGVAHCSLQHACFCGDVGVAYYLAYYLASNRAPVISQVP